MKKFALLIPVIPAMLTFQACNRDSNQDNTVEVDSGIVSAKDTTTQVNIPVEKGDAQFIVEAAAGGTEEIALGKLAQQKAADLRIKNFGKMMVANHAKLSDNIKALASAKKIAIPMTTNDQKAITALSNKTGSAFDKAYIDSMISNHEKDINTFEAASQNCQDPAIKAFAKKTLPVLRSHLDAINAIKESMN